ncbi:MAG: hypothetical protein KGD63_15665 [Candidatus Lokiarchaeota archaeon]|nr:hypothetical protein [Candidatus Lokiarchaeota archaeon]
MESKYAKQRIINDIKSDDLQIQVTGYVEDINGNKSFILNDDTGKIKVNLKDIILNYKEKDIVNVIGDLQITTSGEKILEANIIQDMKKLNFKYYKRLYKLKKEILEE